MRGLASLTEPASDEPVAAIVDLAVMGARGDGKTQLIVHAIRTLRAYGPPLTGAERAFHRDILEVVMNAHAPRPEATPPGVVPHYVFRIRPQSLLAQVGLGSRLGLYRRTAGLLGHWLLALGNAAVLGAVLGWLRGGLDAVAAGAGALALVAGMLAGVAAARRRFVRRGEIEIVFWDVAGEHVYSGSAADYHGFLGALVARRRELATPERAYAFAPVLLCNPTGLGTRAQGSSYTRLRQILPMFASLGEPRPHAMVAINRWAVVDRVCAPDADRDEIVAVVPRPRAPDEDAADQARPGGGQPAPTGSEAGDAVASATQPPLPAVRRDVVRAHCMDAEDSRGSDMSVTYLRYDAGMQCELHERPWPGWEAMDAEVRAQWQAPAGPAPQHVLDYVYEDGPGAFEGDARRTFLGWLASLAFHRSAYGPEWEPEEEGDGDEDGERSDEEERVQVARAGGNRGEARFGPEARSGSRPESSSRSRPEARPEARPEDRPQAQPDERADWGEVGAGSPRAPGARALSASGLEDFARHAIANAIVTDEEHPASEPGDPAPAASADQGAPAGDGQPDEPAGVLPGDGPARRDKKSDTLPLSGGFGTSGT